MPYIKIDNSISNILPSEYNNQITICLFEKKQKLDIADLFTKSINKKSDVIINESLLKKLYIVPERIGSDIKLFDGHVTANEKLDISL